MSRQVTVFLPEMKAEETDFDGVLTEFEFGGKPIMLNEG